MHGNVMFRGPRVKMGVYSGTPTRVIPHTTTGRADYFGPLVGCCCINPPLNQPWCITAAYACAAGIQGSPCEC